jgi:hypothetical protein
LVLQRLAIRAHHGPSQLVEEGPGRLIPMIVRP